MSDPPYQYSAHVVRWVDGDTVDLAVDVGFYITTNARFRLWGIDTPERGQPLHDEATRNANELAPAGSRVLIQTFKAPDKYGRFLVVIANEFGDVVNDDQIERGFAVPYFGGHK